MPARVRTASRIVVAWIVTAAAAVAAQDAPATPPPPDGPPTHRGRDKVTEPIGQRGAILELANGATLTLPSGLPIGSSRVLTFSTSRQRVTPSAIAEGFAPVGAALAFDGAINASSSPLVLTLRQPRFRERETHRAVLAIETAGLCDDSNRRFTLPGGLCSTWTVVDATFDAASGVLRAEIPRPGGYRLQFGTVPRPAATPAPPLTL